MEWNGEWLTDWITQDVGEDPSAHVLHTHLTARILHAATARLPRAADSRRPRGRSIRIIGGLKVVRCASTWTNAKHDEQLAEFASLFRCIGFRRTHPP